MTAVVALGSNLGDRLGHLRAGIDLLARRFPLVAVSPVYESVAVGGPEQPAYLNAVVLLRTSDAGAVLDTAQEAERDRGRLRSVRWGPRPLDVDVVSVDALRSADPRLTLPHPLAHERAFVLLPWADVDAAAELPGRGPIRALLRRVDPSGVRRWAA